MAVILLIIKNYYVILSYSPLMGFLLLIFFSIIGLVTFLGLLYFFGEFGQKEIDVIINAIHPGKMKEHISSELKKEVSK